MPRFPALSWYQAAYKTVGALFVFGWLGLPELGMPGASVGNFCARVLVCVATVYILVNHHQLIRMGQTKNTGAGFHLAPNSCGGTTRHRHKYDWPFIQV